MWRGALLGVAMAVLVAAPAQAAFPGRNGLIAFVSNYEPTTCGEHSCEVDLPRLYTVRPDGQEQTRVSPCDESWDCEDSFPAWSPDGSRMAFTHNGEIWVMDADGSGAHTLGRRGEEPTWAPEGRRIAFASSQGGIATIRADGTHLRRLTEGGDSAPSWSVRGVIAYTHHVPQRLRTSIITMRPGGHRLTHFTRPHGAANADFSPDGRLIAFEAGTRLRVSRPDGSHSREIARNAGDPAWSPDGRSIAFDRLPGNSRFYEIFVARRDGSKAHRVPYDTSLRDRADDPTGDYSAPSWQPLSR
jgi:Tol biopolymer transport system component